MKRILYGGISIIFALLAVSCEQLAGPDDVQTDGMKEIKLSAGLNAYTKATDTAFENGDAIGVSIITNGDYEIDNAKFTVTGGELAPDQTYYWYEDESLKSTVFAYYPYASSLAGSYNASGMEFTVSLDQSTHKLYTQSDLMMAKAEDVTPTEDAVHLAFNHMLSKLVINIDNNLGEEIREVWLSGVYTSVNVSPVTYEMNVVGSEGSIKAGKLAVKGNESWVLIVAPQADVLPEITVVTESQELTYTLPEAVTFSSSKQHSAEVVIEADNEIKVDFVAEIYDWEDGEDMYFEREDDDEDVPVVPPSIFKETDIWDIAYVGRTAEGYEGFDIKTNRDSLLYYVSSYPAYYVTEYGYSHTELAADVAYTVSSLLQRGYQPADILVAGSNMWYEPRLQSDDYYVYAVGFNPDGTPTYEYSVANITVEEEEALPEYEKWLGTWSLTSSEGYMNGTKLPSATYTITIQPYENNYMYAVTGWETVGADYDMSEALGDLAFPAYFVDGELVFEEYDIMPITFDDGGEASHLFGLYAYGDIVMEGQNYPGQIVGFSGYGIPMAKTSSAGSSIQLLGQTYEEPGLTINYKAMGYMAIPYVQNEYVQIFNYPMFFPITMEKAATRSMASACISSAEPIRFKKDLGQERKKIEPRMLKPVRRTF